MLDGRVKTLHPRIHGGILADRSKPTHRAQLAGAAIAPFELVVVNLYPFAQAAERPGIDLAELVEEIDIGGPAMVRAAAKNLAIGRHRHLARPATRRSGRAARRRWGATRRARGARRRAFRHVGRLRRAHRRPSCHGGWRPRSSCPTSRAPPARRDPFPPTLPLAFEQVETLRYGENPHQAAALYRRPRHARRARARSPRARDRSRASRSATTTSSMRPPRRLSRATCAAPPARSSSTPIRAAPRSGRPAIGVAGGAGRRPGERVRRRRRADRHRRRRARRAAGGDLPRGRRRARLRSRCARQILAGQAATCALLADPSWPPLSCRSVGRAAQRRRRPAGRHRPTSAPDDPANWKTVTSREPTAAELADLDLAWRICRHVKSNAIVLVRDGALVGTGAGQMSRVDSARLAVDKAGERALGAACASDAFYPFPDAVEVCVAAGVDGVRPAGRLDPRRGGHRRR